MSFLCVVQRELADMPYSYYKTPKGNRRNNRCIKESHSNFISFEAVESTDG